MRVSSLKFRAGWLAVLLVGGTVSWANETDGESFVVIKAGRVITVSGQEYAPGMVVIADGKIRLVGAQLEYPDGAKIIDAGRETVMPGLIDARSRFGLPTFSRSGVHGDQKAVDEVIPSEIEFEAFLRAGYTAVCFYPAGTGIPGVAGVVRTAGPESERHVRDRSYLRITMTNVGRDKRALRDALKKAQAEIDKVEKARKEWEAKQAEKAKAAKAAESKQGDKPKPKDGDDPKPDPKPTPKPEPKPNPKPNPKPKSASESAADSAPPKPAPPKKEPKGDADKTEDKPEESETFKPPEMDPRYLPLIDLIQDKKDVPLFVELGRASDLHHLDEVLETHDDFPVRYYLSVRLPRRETDYFHAVELLGEREAAVLLSPALFFRPLTIERYNLVLDLVSAGCELSFVPWGDSETELRRVRQRSAELVRAGLDRTDALKALTLHPAKLLGLGDRLGSLEKDKDADIVFLSGDPLDPHTEISRVMILGDVVWTKKDDQP